MRANTVTQSNKRNFPNATIGAILEFSNIPKTYYYNDLLFMDFQDHTEFHEDAGFLEVVYATITDEATEKLGAIYKDINVYRKDVGAKSQQEIEDYQDNLRNNINSNANRDQKIKEASDAMIVAELMNETGIETILGNLDIYPIWEVGLSVLNKTDSPNGIPDRFKAFNAENELTLYEVVLSHDTQSDWHPKDTPALWKVVAPEGTVPVWIRPTGAHDAYNIGDQVHFPTASDPVYKSKINSNTYSPLEYPAGWELVL